jgi:hypothetical protein
VCDWMDSTMKKQKTINKHEPMSEVRIYIAYSILLVVLCEQAHFSFFHYRDANLSTTGLRQRALGER